MTNDSNGNSSNDQQTPKLNDFDTTKSSDAVGPAPKPGKSAGDKKKGNRNAMTHGLYSKFVILPDESESEFRTLLDDLGTEWLPSGRSEVEAVFDLGYLILLKQRLRKWAQSRFQGWPQNNPRNHTLRDKEALPLDTEGQKQSQNSLTYGQFKDVSDLLARLDAQIDKTLRRLTSLKVLKRNEPNLFEVAQVESVPMVPDDTPETELPSETVKTETDQS